MRPAKLANDMADAMATDAGYSPRKEHDEAMRMQALAIAIKFLRMRQEAREQVDPLEFVPSWGDVMSEAATAYHAATRRDW